MWALGVLIWEIFSLIDEYDNVGDDDASHLPYHQLTLKQEVHLSFLITILHECFEVAQMAAS